MLFAVGAASSVIDLLSSLASPPGSASKTGFGHAPSTGFSPADPGTQPSGATSSGGAIAPASFNTLLAAQSQGQATSSGRSAALKDLFSQIDADGDGKISKTEFETALGAGGTNLQMADDVFSKLDRNGDGSVTLDEMASGLRGSRHHHSHGNGGGAGPLQGATSSTSTNSDGSTTTTLTYADGTRITMTQPAVTSQNAISSYNFTERLIQRQAQAVAAGAQQSLSLSL